MAFAKNIIEKFGCCGAMRRGPYCSQCGMKINPLHALATYLDDRASDDSRKSGDFREWCHELIRLLESANTKP